jgi:hypothetical protein
MTRRFLLGGAAVALSARHRLAANEASNIAKEMEAVLTRIRPPQFPDRVFAISQFGASPGGKNDATEAIRKAIAACERSGGGRVVVPRGEFLTGPIRLLSNTNLHLEDGATLLFSRDPKRYLPLVLTRFEGTECMNYSPLIYAFQQTNVAVTGNGMLDGQAGRDHWWPWKGNAKDGWKQGDPNQKKAADTLVAMADKDVPVSKRVFGEGHYLRPSFFEPYGCTNVQIEGVSIRNSPMWELHPVLCRNVTVRDVKNLHPRAQQRRLRSGIVHRRAHRAMRVRYRRRLHRHQVRTQPRRAQGGQAVREHRGAGMQHERRPRRDCPGQRGLRQHPQRLHRPLPHGQPQPAAGVAAQDEQLPGRVL